MTRLSPLFFCVVIFFTATLVCQSSWGVDYVQDVFPILESRCAGCHSSSDAEGGFSLDTHDSLMKGGDSGLAITPGVASSSRLMLMVSGKLDPIMPPEDEPGLTEDELQVLTDWVDQGAQGPNGDMPQRREIRAPKTETKPGVIAPVTAIRHAKDENLVATAQFGVVAIQDSAGQTIQHLDGFPGKVNSLQFDSTGTKLLVASGLTGVFGEASLVDLSTGESRLFAGHADTLYAARISPDGKSIATAGYDRTIQLWDAESGLLRNVLKGHNGAIFDLAFSPDSTVLVSASADETVKVWHVENGERLDTLSQPQGEVYAVDITRDGQHVIAASADNRLRIWQLISKRKPAINPLIATRYVDESALVAMDQSPDGQVFVLVSEAGNVKVIRQTDWNIAGSLDPVGSVPSDVSVAANGRQVVISLMNGGLETRSLPSGDSPSKGMARQEISPVWLDLGKPKEVQEASADGIPQPLPRGAMVAGVIAEPEQVDRFRWRAKQGEMWAIDADAFHQASKDDATKDQASPLDPVVWIEDERGKPIVRVRLQALRDSYFTFRGKDSVQSNDFRMFAWREMHLNDYLYAAGEVTKLWMHPRGPDSGFNVYPGTGSRWTYFGTTHSVHALGEPAYIVRPLEADEQPLANGLPVFTIDYRNDDDPTRQFGKSSRLLFKAPRDGEFMVAIADTRREGGADYGYRLAVRAAAPGFQPKVTKISKPIFAGAGREFEVSVQRADGFDGAVQFDVIDLPPGLHATTPIEVEPGQRSAEGILWADEGFEMPESLELKVVARGHVHGRSVERDAGTLGKLKMGGMPKLKPAIERLDGESASSAEAPWKLTVRRGETVSAKVVLNRAEGFQDEVSLGKEFAARNASHGVIVDNIGLNGLLILQGDSEREFFITADRQTHPGIRWFHLKAGTDGGITSLPIQLEVQ